MHITFVGWGSEQLSITLLSHLAKRHGHQVSLAFSAALFQDQSNSFLSNLFDDSGLVINGIKKNNPDVVAFSPLTNSFQWMLRIAREIKSWNPEIKTVFGGVHVSAVPDLAIQFPEIDFLVVGDGEEAFINILNSIQEDTLSAPIPNTLYKCEAGMIQKGQVKGFYQDIDTLPYFTKELWQEHTITDFFNITMASRGCPYRCTFCFNNFFAELPDDKKSKGKYLRIRSIEHIIEELVQVKKSNPGLKYIDFEDDIFTVNKQWILSFLEEFKKQINIPFVCLSHPKYMDEEIAMALKKAGCQWVQIGIQSVDEGFKNEELRRLEKNTDVYRSLKSLINAGVKVKVDHMLGLPGENIQAQEKARQVYAEFCPSKIDTYWTTYLPGTELLKNAVRDQMISIEQERLINEGRLLLYFNSSENVQDKKTAEIYESYEFIFKLYPLLPRYIRQKVTLKTIHWIPGSIKNKLKLLLEATHAIVYQNPEKLFYVRNIMYHIPRIIRYKYLSTKKAA